jgi:hypothetical protein
MEALYPVCGLYGGFFSFWVLLVKLVFPADIMAESEQFFGKFANVQQNESLPGIMMLPFYSGRVWTLAYST